MVFTIAALEVFIFWTDELESQNVVYTFLYNEAIFYLS